MHVDRCVGIGRRQLDVLVQRLSGHVGKPSLMGRAMTCMTPGTKVYLALSRESCRIQNRCIRRSGSFGLEMLDMGTPRTVTLLANDTHSKIALAVTVGRWRECFEKCPMTFQTTRNNGTIEICDAIAISR